MNQRKIRLWQLSVISTAVALMLVVSAHSPVVARKAAGPAWDAAALFESKCAVCHGQDGRGTEFGREKGAPDFSETRWQQAHTDAQIQEAIANGKGKFMPAWKT